MSKYNKLSKFRFDTYQMLVKARDATFELMDSIMTTKNADSVADQERERAPREAKDLVAQNHLPWQKAQENLTPQRVAQSMFSLLIEIGSPTRLAKTRGKSAGCHKGQKHDLFL